ncbi:hypothetical protein [Microbacterium thalli]|uniref:MoeA C-terminal domain-containing protein n=1 Tax=Microbacterium thalli TaxID=3027921 RepID=A0ABT5SE18_9MICO|nr:hypothetical protein [Microbacterium thalli]MDD7928385.1 hypothetical protein [Microbacterium thalli]MDD7960966.1 hypothetical protein [Microbacterium thalli]
MTLTSILPTLRRSIPSPLSRDAWPARTVPTCDDIVVGGISVTRYVALCGLPAVMTAPAVIPLSGGMPSTTASTTVLILEVSVARPADEVPALVLAAALDDAVHPVWSEARLLARVSSAPDHRFAVCGDDGTRLPGVALVLPADVRPGDLVAVPCPGAVGVGDIRPRPAAAPADARPDAERIA